MNNVCKIKEYETKEIGQPTFKDILMELNRLKLENGVLKADKSELIKENQQLKNNNKALHSMIENKNETKEFLNNDEGGFTEEEFDILAQGYANFGY